MSSLHKITVSLFLVFFSFTASGGDPSRALIGADEAGMAYVCVMKSSFWTSFHNQASLANNKSFSFGFNYENRFGIKELGTRSAAIIVPAGKGSVGTLFSHFGYSDYSRKLAALACGLSLSNNVSAGVQIDYFSEKLPSDYRNMQSVTFEAGLQVTISERIKLGMHVFNPVPNSLRTNYLPSVIRIGAGASLNNSLFSGLEAEMSTGNNLIIRTGFEYEAGKNLWMRGGFSTCNSSFCFGLGYLSKITKIDIGFTTHEKLGVTTSVSLTFRVGQNQ